MHVHLATGPAGTRRTLEIGDDFSGLRRARAWVRDQVAELPAELAARWGQDSAGDGKVVWAGFA